MILLKKNISFVFVLLLVREKERKKEEINCFLIGDGDPPSSSLSFFEALERNEFNLTDLNFAVLALGGNKERKKERKNNSSFSLFQTPPIRIFAPLENI